MLQITLKPIGTIWKLHICNNDKSTTSAHIDRTEGVSYLMLYLLNYQTKGSMYEISLEQQLGELEGGPEGEEECDGGSRIW